MSLPVSPKMCRPRYRLIRDVGKGASGTAQLMEDETNAQYIMKSIQTDKLKDRQIRNAINEIKILNELRHPFIVRYRESFIDGSHLRIIMDYCSGGDLSSRITHQRKEVKKKFKEQQIMRWLAQAVMALADMHKRHIMHRDLKPLNMFLDGNDGRLRLGDFGISKILDDTVGLAHTFVGTPSYMSPEVVQHSGKGYGSGADMWSLGCVLYELCTFKTPYHSAQSMTELMGMLTDRKPVPPIPSGYYSEALIGTCQQMLMKNPKKRPTAQELLKSPIVQAGIVEMLTSCNFFVRPTVVSPFSKPLRKSVSPDLKSPESPMSPDSTASTVAEKGRGKRGEELEAKLKGIVCDEYEEKEASKERVEVAEASGEDDEVYYNVLTRSLDGGIIEADNVCNKNTNTGTNHKRNNESTNSSTEDGVSHSLPSMSSVNRQNGVINVNSSMPASHEQTTEPQKPKARSLLPPSPVPSTPPRRRDNRDDKESEKQEEQGKRKDELSRRRSDEGKEREASREGSSRQKEERRMCEGSNGGSSAGSSGKSGCSSAGSIGKSGGSSGSRSGSNASSGGSSGSSGSSSGSNRSSGGSNGSSGGSSGSSGSSSGSNRSSGGSNGSSGGSSGSRGSSNASSGGSSSRSGRSRVKSGGDSGSSGKSGGSSGGSNGSSCGNSCSSGGSSGSSGVA